MKKVIVHNKRTYSKTVEEYTDFNRIYDKYVNKGEFVEYEFESPEDALIAVINHKSYLAFIIHSKTNLKAIKKPIMYKGLKLSAYFEWNGYVFLTTGMIYIFVGKINEEL